MDEFVIHLGKYLLQIIIADIVDHQSSKELCKRIEIALLHNGRYDL